MNRQQAENLETGDRVIIWRATPHECKGNVALRFPQSVEFTWDDGDTSVIHLDDMRDVEQVLG